MRRLLSMVLACAACASGEEPRATSVSSAITSGQLDTNDAVVALARDGNRLCTGALVAPNVVLTARHCVSKTNGLGSRCDDAGNEIGGARFDADDPPSSIRVFVGQRPDLAKGTPAALGAKAFYAAAAAPCNADLALLVLDRPIAGVQPLALRLGAATRAEETLRAVGYGRTETGAIGERRHRDGVRVLAAGPRAGLGAREIEASQSFCDGDSGGPALSASGAVVGVVSRGPACEQPSGYVYATLPGFRAVFDEVGASFARETGDRDPPADAGDVAASSDASPAIAYDRGLPARCAYAPSGDGRSAALSAVILCALRAIRSCVRRKMRGTPRA